MQPHHTFGGTLAITGIINLVVFIMFIMPRIKAPPKTKQILRLAVSAGSVLMLVLGAVISLLGEGWFG